MAEHPILFSTEMVKAILDGRKTQTRRIAKLPEKWHRGFKAFENNPNGAEEFVIHGDCGTETIYCPYGALGDRLWVRETWLLNGSANTLRIQYKASDSEYRPDDKKWCGRLVSKHAPEHISDAQNMWDKHNEKIKGLEIPWRSSRFMPKWAARIFLEITNIRVERVQDISWEDIIAEGCDVKKPTGDPAIDDFTAGVEVIDTFHWLWDSLNTKRGYGWDKNPWVWVIEFKLALKGN